MPFSASLNYTHHIFEPSPLTMNTISGGSSTHGAPQMSVIDILFPGFSVASSSAQQLLAGNMNSYTRLFCTLGMVIFFTRYAIRYIWDLVRNHFSKQMSRYVEIWI